MRTRHHLLIVLAGLALLSPPGCRQDAIETHRVEIPEPPPPPEAKVRLLGAIIPHAKDTWFFKVVGPLDAVEPLKAPFEDFVRSARFDDAGEPIAWKVPEGWQRLPENPERYATFHVGLKDAPLELTVHRYEDAAQMRSTFSNVERWGRLYVGLKVLPKDLEGYVHEDKTAAGVPITFVDMKGPGGTGGGGMKPPVAGGKNPHAPQEKLSYTTPEGWKETDPVITRGGMTFRYEAALKVEKGGASALVTVSKLAGTGGGLLMNVNRWRTDQLGLPPLDKDQLIDAAKPVKLGSGEGFAVDFKGPGQPAGKEERRILGVVVPREGETWFIKMDGPAGLVGEQKAAFDTFVGSVKFDGGEGG